MNHKEIAQKMASALMTQKALKKKKKESIKLPKKSVIEICDFILDMGAMLFDMMPECYGDKSLLTSKEYSLCFRCCWLSACKKECQKNPDYDSEV